MEPIETSSPSYRTNPIQQIKSSHLYKLVLAQQAKIQQHLSSNTLLPTTKLRSKEQPAPTSLLYANKLRSKEQPPSDSPIYNNKLRNREPPILRDPKKTNPIVWFGAILCMVFSLLLIFFAMSTLIIFLVVKPKAPVFDTPAAAMSLTRFNEFLRSDLTFLANFSNPNWKLNVRYEYVYFQLLFQGARISDQVVQPFSQRPEEARWISVHLLSELFRFPPNLALEWLHGDCQIEMTSPPTSVLISHSCKTKR